MMIAVSATLRMPVSSFVVDNAFQCTPQEVNDKNPPLFITMPPLYIPWYCKHFPNNHLKGQGPWVLQCLKQMQGIKDTGRKFYMLMKSIFANIGVHPTSVDGGFYAFVYKEQHLVFLCSETDDFLVSTSCEETRFLIKNELQKAFGITLQTGE
jgi:hypothetical protein